MALTAIIETNTCNFCKFDTPKCAGVKYAKYKTKNNEIAEIHLTAIRGYTFTPYSRTVCAREKFCHRVDATMYRNVEKKHMAGAAVKKIIEDIIRL